MQEAEKKYILHRSEIPADGLFDRAAVERLLDKIYGSNVFESVTYRLEGREEPYTLVFDCRKGQVNDFAVGIRGDVDETVALAVHLGLGTRRLAGPRFAADLKLGTNPALALDCSYKFMKGLPTIGVTARTRMINTASGYMSNQAEHLLTAAVDAYLEDSRMRFGSMRLGFTAEMDPYEHYLAVDEAWQGWDWKSYWLSGFASFKYDSFNDGYFPTRGVRLGVDGRYVFNGYSIDLDPARPDYKEGNASTPDGRVPGYASVLASFQGAFSIGSDFTILPSLYVGWYSSREEDNFDNNCLNPKHIITIGGFIPNRYTERQIPFFGFAYGFRNCRPVSAVAQLDLRYRFARKNYVTARGGVFNDAYNFREFFDAYPSWTVGLEYARQTLVGPLKLAAQWCDITGFSVYASIGFDF